MAEKNTSQPSGINHSLTYYPMHFQSLYAKLSCIDTLMQTSHDIKCLLSKILIHSDPECGTSDKLLLLACEDKTLRCIDVRNREKVLELLV